MCWGCPETNQKRTWGFWWAPDPGKCPGGKAWAQTEAREVPSVHQEMHFHCEGDQTLAHISQGGCGISILGDTKKPAEHAHEQPAVGGPA